MTVLASDVVEVRDILGAGRGVLATRLIPSGSIVLESDGPAVHVIFHQYTKETCARCFQWDRGRRLKIREQELGKAFCSVTCQEEWRSETGPTGIECWGLLKRSLDGVLGKNKGASKNNKRGHAMDAKEHAIDPNGRAMDAKPGPDDIDIAWRDAAELALLLRAPPPIGKRERKAMQALQRSLQAQVARIDAIADTLAYFLEAALSHRRHPSTWQRDMLDLAVDTTPYTDPQHLADSCTAFLHLVTILPAHLLPHLTAGMCRSLVGADNHNAFGIRAGGEDGEEYMGYGVYPAASYFNHSCAPNITKQRIGPSWIFTAARDIGPGEECCITYLGGDEKDLDVVARRARLEQVWAFGCSCARCCQDEASRRPCSAALDS